MLSWNNSKWYASYHQHSATLEQGLIYLASTCLHVLFSIVFIYRVQPSSAIFQTSLQMNCSLSLSLSIAVHLDAPIYFGAHVSQTRLHILSIVHSCLCFFKFNDGQSISGQPTVTHLKSPNDWWNELAYTTCTNKKPIPSDGQIVQILCKTVQVLFVD